MGIDLSALIQGLTTGARGVQEGLSERRQLERQARQQLLTQRLHEAQIANLQSEVTRRAAQTAAEQTRPRAPVMGSPEWVAAQGAGARARAQAAAGVKSRVALTPNEQRAARQVVKALREMRALYQKNKSAAQTPLTSAALQGIGKLPLIGGLAAGVTGPAAQAAMSRDQQAFQRAATTLRHHYAMIAPHSRVTLGLLHDINTAIVPPAGTDPATIEQSFVPEWEYTLSQLEPVAGTDTGGAAALPAQTPAPSSDLILDNAGPRPATPNYHKKFWKPKSP